MTWRFVFLLLCTPIASSCGDSPTSPDETTTTTVTTSSVVFEGTLEQEQSSFYAFTASQSGSVTVNLASLNLVGHREALTVPVRIGVGVPKGEGCRETESIETLPALVSQFSATLESGIHCVNIADTGQLPGAAVFLIRFSHY
jgi:hypothetical protein